MTYNKPEIAVLGDASLMIQGSLKQTVPDIPTSEHFDGSDCELDD